MTTSRTYCPKQSDKHSYKFLRRIVLCLLAACAFLPMRTMFRTKIRTHVQAELGTAEVNVSDFLRSKNGKAFLLENITAEMLRTPGEYALHLCVDHRVCPVSLSVSDTTAPVGVTVMQETAPGKAIAPEAFFSSYYDESPVTFSFIEAPDFEHEGFSSIKIRLCDACGNSREYTVLLHVGKVRSRVSVDIDHPSVSAEDFLLSPASSVVMFSDLDSLIAGGIGEYPVLLEADGVRYSASLCVTDLTAPVAESRNVRIYPDTTAVEPSEFVQNIRDRSAVTVSFVTPPVYGVPGDQFVTVRLTDASGNYTDYTSVLSVVPDTEPPVFEGLNPIYVYVNGSISYKSGVSAVDAKDGAVTFTVDSSAVNLHKAGTYQLVYRAQDAAGNQTEQLRKIVVENEPVITQEMVDEQVQKTLKKIGTASMSKADQLEAIYNWITDKSNMSYTEASEPDELTAAYKGFIRHYGDCYNYYAMTKYLLNACGIENKMVRRVGGKTDHYWLLVNIGTGWYHVDTTPHASGHEFRSFMLTDEEILAYNATRPDKPYYYDFDPTQYPERATVSYQKPEE